MNKSAFLNRALLNYLAFVICCWVALAAFLTTRTYLQLAIAVAFYPIFVYIIFRIFPRKRRKYHAKPVETVVESENDVALPQEENSGLDKKNGLSISDIDKRVFLKLIGGAGIAFFIFSLFNRKAESILFKDQAGTGASGKVALQDGVGKTIDPAQNQPTDGYIVSEIDDGANTFVGYTRSNGSWYIMKQDGNGSFRYVKGGSNFPMNWIDREILKYDYYNNVFRA